jgi:hypothetical protein
MKNCSVCGKDTEMEDRTFSAAGMEMAVYNTQNSPDKNLFIQKQLGEYKTDTKYIICYECLLKALGVKPT